VVLIAELIQLQYFSVTEYGGSCVADAWIDEDPEEVDRELQSHPTETKVWYQGILPLMNKEDKITTQSHPY
jgi:hypothetical protein